MVGCEGGCEGGWVRGREGAGGTERPGILSHLQELSLSLFPQSPVPLLICRAKLSLVLFQCLELSQLTITF